MCLLHVSVPAVAYIVYVRELDGPSEKEPDPITIICQKNEPDPITILFPKNEPDQIVI